MRIARAFLYAVGLLAALCFCFSYGQAAEQLADPTTDTAGFFGQLWQALSQHRWDTAGVLATIGFVAFARVVAPRLHGAFGDWVRSSRVSAVLAFLGGTSAALAATALNGGKITAHVLVGGFGFGIAAIGGYNALFDLFFAPAKKPNLDGPLVLPPPVRPGLLLPFFLVAGLGLSACATPGGAALGACELGKVPQILQVAIATVTQALAGATWEEDLTQVGKGLAPGQLDCIVEAIVTATQKRGSISATGLAVVEHGRSWLAKRGAHNACRDYLIGPAARFRSLSAAPAQAGVWWVDAKGVEHDASRQLHEDAVAGGE